jgi:hypothetical protein
VSPDWTRCGVVDEFLASVVVVLDDGPLGGPVAAYKGIPSDFVLLVHCGWALEGGGIRWDDC